MNNVSLAGGSGVSGKQLNTGSQGPRCKPLETGIWPCVYTERTRYCSLKLHAVVNDILDRGYGSTRLTTANMHQSPSI